MSDLDNMTLTALRAKASGLGIKSVMSKSKAQLIAALADTVKPPPEPAPEPLPPMPVSAPAGSGLEPYIARGMSYREIGGRWYMSFCGRTDEGSLSMPARDVQRCARRLMR